MSVLERYLATPEPVDLARPDRLDSFSSRATGTVGLTDGGSSCLVLAALTWVLSGYVIRVTGEKEGAYEDELEFSAVE